MNSTGIQHMHNAEGVQNPTADVEDVPDGWRKTHNQPGLHAHQAASIPLHCAETLTGTDNLAHIRLNDMIYTLRITRGGKLILTK